MEKEITNANELRLKKLLIDTSPEFVEWANKNLSPGLREFKLTLLDKFKKYCNNPYIDKHMSTNKLTRWISKYCELFHFDVNMNYGSGGVKIWIKEMTVQDEITETKFNTDKFGTIGSIPKSMSCSLCKYIKESPFSSVCVNCVKNNRVNEYYK